MLKITKKAEKYLSSMITRKKALGIEITVKNTGCSGKSYLLQYLFEKKCNINEYVQNHNDIIVKVSKKDIDYLENIKIDISESEFNTKIIFSNPNAFEKCGCGESFKFNNNKDES